MNEYDGNRSDFHDKLPLPNKQACNVARPQCTKLTPPMSPIFPNVIAAHPNEKNGEMTYIAGFAAEASSMSVHVKAESSACMFAVDTSAPLRSDATDVAAVTDCDDFSTAVTCD